MIGKRDLSYLLIAFALLSVACVIMTYPPRYNDAIGRFDSVDESGFGMNLFEPQQDAPNFASSGVAKPAPDYVIEPIDDEPPETTAELIGEIGLDGWYISNVELILEAQDYPLDLSVGVDYIEYKSQASDVWNIYTGPITIEMEGHSNISYRAVDNSGNVEPVKSITFKIDKTAPQSSIDAASPWYGIWYGTSSVEVQLLVTENTTEFVGSYRLDSGEWQPYENGTIVSIEGEGLHQLEYNATDAAGNVESTKTHEIGIDLTPPTVNPIISGLEGSEGWWLSDVEVVLDAKDNYSGISEFQYTVDFDPYDGNRDGNTFTLSAEGEHYITWELIDHMGRRSRGSLTIKIDQLSPQTVLSYEDTEEGVVVTLSATDSTSGVNQTAYSFDGETWILYSSPFTLESGGLVSVHFNSTDLAGNVETTKTEIIELDLTPPLTDIELQGQEGLNGWYISNVTVNLTATDNETEVAMTAYSFDGTTWMEYVKPIIIWEEGVFEIYFNSTDIVGNIEQTKAYTIKIDKSAPETTLSIYPAPVGVDLLYISSISELTLTAADDSGGSGVSAIEYRIDANDWAVYVSPLNIPLLGRHTFQYRGIDYAGNTEPSHSVSLIVNATRLVYSGNTAGTYSDMVHIQARLFDVALESPISGKKIVFNISGIVAHSLTNSEGFATVSPVLNLAMGEYPLMYSFYGDAEYLGVSNVVAFIVSRENASVSYTGQTIASTTTPNITLRATVIEEEDGHLGNISKAYISFLISSASTEDILVFGPYQVNETDVDGLGVVMVLVSIDLSDDYWVQIIFPSDINQYYLGENSEPASLTVVEPTRHFVTGGGWIVDSETNRGHFGFVVKYKKSGMPWGHAVYIYRGNGWLYTVKTRAILGLAVIDDHAFFEATAFILKINFETKKIVLDTRNYILRIDVWDRNKDGGVDVFQIRILDDNGLLFHEAGFAPHGYLQGGNIVIHYAKKHPVCKWKKKKWLR